MSFLRRLLAIFQSTRGGTEEDIAAHEEARRLQDEQETIRLSQTRGAGSAGQNYQSGR